MNPYQRVRHLSEKINNLVEAVSKNGGNFSSIDKDMLTSYVRDLYELIVSIQPTTIKNIPAVNDIPVTKPFANGEELNGKEEKPERKIFMNHEEGVIHQKDVPSKKSISDIFAEKQENAAPSVNEKFKKQGKEIADKLKQTPIKDLKAYIGLNKQFAFMNKLFNGDEQLYEEAIAKVNSFKTYEEATGYIQSNLLPALNWADDEPLVSEFFMLVMRRYLN